MIADHFTQEPLLEISENQSLFQTDTDFVIIVPKPADTQAPMRVRLAKRNARAKQWLVRCPAEVLWAESEASDETRFEGSPVSICDVFFQVT